MRLRTKLLLTVPLIAAASVAQSAAVDPASVPGPALAIRRPVPRRACPCGRGRRRMMPARFYFGAVNGGVWRTDDAGRTWAPIFDRSNVGSIGAIAVAPSAPKTHLRRHRRSRHALRHRPGHRHVPVHRRRPTWSAIGLPTRSRSARSWSIRATRRSLLVAALGHPYGPNAERGVFRSTDGGQALDQDIVQGREYRRDRSCVRARAIRASSMPRCGRRGGRRGTPIRRRTVLAAGFTNRLTAAGRWRQLTGHGLPGAAGADRPRHQLPPSRSRVYALDGQRRTPTRAASTARTIAASTWRKVTGDKRIWNRGWYFGGITAESEERRPDLVAEHDHPPVGRRRRAFHPGEGRSRPATTSTLCGSTRRIPTGASSASTRARW